MASTGEAGRFRVLSVVLSVLGALLLVVAGAGPLAWDLAHHRGRAGLPGYDYATAAPLSGWDDPRLTRRPGEATLPYVTRVNRAVADAIYHCEPGDPQTWAAGVMAALDPKAIATEGLLAPAALRCGYCSQVSFVTAETLRRNGIPSARARGLDGHVVTGFAYQSADYVTDPDFGVGPLRVEWDDPKQLAQAVEATYPATSVSLVQPIYVDTSTDAPYSRKPYLQAMAAEQEARIQLLERLRWVGVAVGAALVLAARRLSAR